MNRSESNALEEGFKSLTLSKLVRASILSTNALLFNGINNVKFLRITLEYPSKGCLKFIPLFPNLIHIDVVFSDFTLNCWDVLEELLRRSPKLQLLFIKKVCLFASFFLFSFICFDKFNLIDHDVVEVLLWIQAGMEMSYFGFWMCFLSPQIMYYFKLRWLEEWSSICNIYFEECESFASHENRHHYKRYGFGKKYDYRRIVLLSNDISRL